MKQTCRIRVRNPGIFPGMIAGDLLPEKKAVFAGRVPDFGWFINVVSKMIVGTSKGDYRDWNAIKDWTVSLCEGGGNNV